MALAWEMLDEEGLLIVRTSGEAPRSPQESNVSLGYAEAIVAAARERGVHDVLLDRRAVVYAASGLSVDLLMHRIAGEFQERRYSDYVRRVAILVRPEHLPATDFYEDVMQNRGVNLRYFGDDAAARAWLSESA
jgi:hypothetical protein